MSETPRPRMIGLNHVAIEVGSIEEALAFYSAIFDVRLRGRGDGAAFIDMGDQFLALMEGPTIERESARHIGIVVDDRGAVRDAAKAAGADLEEGFAFRDPWGNRIEIVEYRDVQFTKADNVLRGMGLHGHKSDDALSQLSAKGMGPN